MHGEGLTCPFASNSSPSPMTGVLAGGGLVATTSAAARGELTVQSCYGSAKNYTKKEDPHRVPLPSQTPDFFKAAAKCADIKTSCALPWDTILLVRPFKPHCHPLAVLARSSVPGLRQEASNRIGRIVVGWPARRCIAVAQVGAVRARAGPSTACARDCRPAACRIHRQQGPGSPQQDSKMGVDPDARYRCPRRW